MAPFKYAPGKYNIEFYSWKKDIMGKGEAQESDTELVSLVIIRYSTIYIYHLSCLLCPLEQKKLSKTFSALKAQFTPDFSTHNPPESLKKETAPAWLIKNAGNSPNK